MNDRELLEAAAKAVNGGAWHPLTHNPPNGAWNPLTDDGDALRLAVRLEITPGYREFSGCGFASWQGGFCSLSEYGPDDPYAATRRAIVRAAAAIGSQA